MPPQLPIIKNKNFLRLLIARIGFIGAVQAQFVIISWQIFSITKDPLMLGLIGLAEALPAMSGALFAGYVVDRGQPYRIFILCLMALVVNAVFLLTVGGGFIPMTESVMIVCLYIGIFISGAARSFFAPAQFALMGQIVPRDQMSAATSWLTTGFQISAIIGPALAGVVYGYGGAAAAWLVPLVMMGLAMIFALGIRVAQKIRETAAHEKLLDNLRDGWQFVFNNPVLFYAMMLDMFAVLFGGAVAMLPAFADEILMIGPEGLGILRASPAIGAMVVAFIFSIRPMKTMSVRRLLFCVAGFGLCIIGFGLSTNFWLSLAFLALSGAFDSISMIIRGTIMQLLTPDAMRGRVSSINSIFLISSNEIGAFESGVAARLMGLVPSVIFGGCMTLAIVGATALASPKFRRAVVRPD